MQIRDTMLENPLTTTPEETFASLLPRLLSSRQATAAVLDDDRRLVGIVGIYDILRSVVPLYVDLDQKLAAMLHQGFLTERLDGLAERQVRELMTEDIDSVAPGDSLTRAVVLIVEKRRKTLPVLEDGRFVGMVTRRTILEKVAPKIL